MDKTTHLSVEEHSDLTGAKMGMWLFLFTEFLLFGGLFLLYAAYRSKYTLDFHTAASGLSVIAGTMNTIILVTSSLSMALAIGANRKGNQKMTAFLLIVTMLLGTVFMINKYFEWGVKIQNGLYPGAPFLLEHERGEILFYGLYFVMTGFHGVHVLIGVALLLYMLVLTLKHRINATEFIRLENTGLFWHLIDIIWIYLFQTFYLMS